LNSTRSSQDADVLETAAIIDGLRTWSQLKEEDAPITENTFSALRVVRNMQATLIGGDCYAITSIDNPGCVYTAGALANPYLTADISIYPLAEGGRTKRGEVASINYCELRKSAPFMTSSSLGLHEGPLRLIRKFFDDTTFTMSDGETFTAVAEQSGLGLMTRQRQFELSRLTALERAGREDATYADVAMLSRAMTKLGFVGIQRHTFREQLDTFAPEDRQRGLQHMVEFLVNAEFYMRVALGGTIKEEYPDDVTQLHIKSVHSPLFLEFGGVREGVLKGVAARIS
jgi:hypothetical protein